MFPIESPTPEGSRRWEPSIREENPVIPPMAIYGTSWPTGLPAANLSSFVSTTICLMFNINPLALKNPEVFGKYNSMANSVRIWINRLEHVPYVGHVSLHKSIDKTNGTSYKNISSSSVFQDHGLLHHACIRILFDADPSNGLISKNLQLITVIKSRILTIYLWPNIHETLARASFTFQFPCSLCIGVSDISHVIFVSTLTMTLRLRTNQLTISSFWILPRHIKSVFEPKGKNFLFISFVFFFCK